MKHPLAERAPRTRSIVIAALLVVIGGAPTAGAQDSAHQTTEAWQIIPLPQSSLVFARDSTLIGEIGHEMRTSVSLKSLPAYVPQAFVAIEDQRFYEHDGVDVIGVLGAIKGKILRENRGGASTITQQLVGYMHPDIIDRREISGTAGLSRKLHEQSAAREMERHYSKQQILEAYLNQINLGRGWFGV
ncbi:MAG: transglycosylase domain-containing protein, partial [Gemmatimonas sp.]